MLLRDSQTSLWYMQYDQGLVPQAFNQKFTKFDKLYNLLEITLRREM